MNLDKLLEAGGIALLSGIVSAIVAVITNRVSKSQERRNERLKAIDEQTVPKKYEALTALYGTLVDCYMAVDQLILTVRTQAALNIDDESWIRFREKFMALEHAHEYARLYISETTCEIPLLRLMTDFYKLSVIASAGTIEHIRGEYAEMEAELDVVTTDIKNMERRDKNLVRRLKKMPVEEREPRLQSLKQLREERRGMMTRAARTRQSIDVLKVRLEPTPESMTILESARQVNKESIDKHYEQVLKCLRSMLNVT